MRLPPFIDFTRPLNDLRPDYYLYFSVIPVIMCAILLVYLIFFFRNKKTRWPGGVVVGFIFLYYIIWAFTNVTA